MGCAVPVKAAEVWPCLLWVFSRAASPQQSRIPLSLSTCKQLGESLALWRCCGQRMLKVTPSAEGAQVFLIMLSVQMGGPEGLC